MKEEIPKFKIGDSVIARTHGNVYEMVQITGAFINIDSTRKEWQYYTTNDKVCAVKESELTGV